MLEGSTPAADGPLHLTFILPTRNRKDWVFRATESCLQAHQGMIHVELLIIDGNSTDGSYEQLIERYGQDARVRIVRQQGAKGFMAACFQSVPMLQTPYATFMYDDDVLSPFWVDLPASLVKNGSQFVMGFSVEEELTKVYPFEQVAEVRSIPPSTLLRGYFGCGHDLSRHGLPFSPICCLTRSDLLRDWLAELELFTKGKPIREHFMMQRNAGPDLMIYLFSIARHQQDIPLLDGPVAQFSAHHASITSGFESTDLSIGYWLAQVWLSDLLRKQRRFPDAGWCAAYAAKIGLRLALRRLVRRQVNWSGALLGEIAQLSARTLFSGAVLSFVFSFLVLLLPRSWRPRAGLRHLSLIFVPGNL